MRPSPFGRATNMAPPMVVVLVAMSATFAQTTTADGDRALVRLTLMIGGEIRGKLLDSTDQVIVLEVDGFPYALAYTQLESSSALQTKRKMLIRTRGGLDRLQASDHLALGSLALQHDRHERARRAFAKAARLDATLKMAGDRLMREFRGRRRDVAAPTENESTERAGTDRDRIIAGYKAIGERLREQVGGHLTLVETPHFLIWTDWAKAEHADLRIWCEAMYTELAARFAVSDNTPVFPGKCPIYCLRSRKRFRKVARLLDDYEATGALGYTSSSDNGHVHVVVCRQGGSTAGRDNFAGTLIHEGVHAFLHRYRTGRHIPAWINEGLADFVAEAVLGDRCPNAETAEATARAVVRGGYGIAELFVDEGMLEARYYPVAHSLVAFMIARDRQAFIGLIDDIKLGASPDSALKQRYDLTALELEAGWRQAVRSAQPGT